MPGQGHQSIIIRSVGGVRDGNRGFILLASLVAIMALASLTVLIQSRAFANQRLASRLTAELTGQLARDAVYDRLRGLIADQMITEYPRQDRPPLNGAPFLVRQDGRNWYVSVQDQAALLDLYLSPQEMLQRVMPNAHQVAAARARQLVAGNRFPRLEMTMARFGISSAESGHFTQLATSSQIHTSNSPTALATLLKGLSPALVGHGQVLNVKVHMRLGG